MSNVKSDPMIREAIIQRMEDRGACFCLPDDQIAWTLHDASGSVIQADNASDLQEALGITSSSSQFRKALGSLMYHHRRVMRCHIDGSRHYKLLSGAELLVNS